MEYEVEVIETLKRQKVIEADSLNQALEKLQEEYKNCNIILNENDFVGVEFRESTDEMIKENFNTQNLLQDLMNAGGCDASDEYSKGCNRLIRDNKASLLLSAEDFVQAMGWNMQTTLSEKVSVQRSLFIELSEEEQKIVAILEKLGNLQINSLVVEADIPVNKMTAILFELEMKGVIRVLAGGMYQLLN